MQTVSHFGMVASFDVVMQNFIKWARGVMKRFLPLPQGWKGTSTKLSSSAPGGWWMWRPYSTLGITSSMGCKSISVTPSGTSTAPLVHCIPNLITAWKTESKKWETCDQVRTRAVVTTEPVEVMANLKWTDHPVNGCPYPVQMRQQSYQHLK